MRGLKLTYDDMVVGSFTAVHWMLVDGRMDVVGDP